jgi:hypothetical protein
MDLEPIVEELRRGPIADAGGLLKPAGRAELAAVIGRLAAGGLRARVVVAPRGAALEPYRALWQRLGLADKPDLLLVFNGERWQARGWGLSEPAIDRALAASQSGLRRYYARGLADALEALAAATGRAPVPGPGGAARGSSVAPWLLGGAGALAAGLVGLAIVRRRRRARERTRALGEARSAAEQVFADVMLAAEDLPESDAGALREKAGRLKGEIDTLAVERKALPPKEESLTLARLVQLENELEALRSVVLQRKRRA